MNPVCMSVVVYYIDEAIQRNKERFWQLEQTAKPKKANISLWYKSSSKGITVLKKWHLRCPNTECPALAQGLESSAGHVHAVNSNLPVHWLQTDKREKPNKKQTRKKSTATTTKPHPLPRLAHTASCSILQFIVLRILYTANGCVSLLPQPDFPLCTHSYCGVHICEFTLYVCMHVGVCQREAR